MRISGWHALRTGSGAMNASTRGSLILAFWAVAVSWFLACGGVADPSMFLTGSESEPLIDAAGQPTCPSSKVLICHFPPGNPANAHSICVGPPAWPPHHRLHGDTLGACGPGGHHGGGGDDAGGQGGGGGHDAGGGGGGGEDAGGGGSGGHDAGAGSGSDAGLL
jgi:hypothetical protein